MYTSVRVLNVILFLQLAQAWQRINNNSSILFNRPIYHTANFTRRNVFAKCRLHNDKEHNLLSKIVALDFAILNVFFGLYIKIIVKH